MRTPSSQLNRLLEASIADKRLEPEFFRALLDARVFAHAPLADTTGRLRLIQFNAPDGELLLPFFSDMGKAKAAGRGRVRIVELSGRQLLRVSEILCERHTMMLPRSMYATQEEDAGGHAGH